MMGIAEIINCTAPDDCSNTVMCFMQMVYAYEYGSYSVPYDEDP